MSKNELEEAASRFACGWGESDDEKSFLSGAKWQAERMYSEEDIKKSFEAGRKGYMRGGLFNKEYFFTWKSFKLWFEQFKKK
jgi:hypothetical protein